MSVWGQNVFRESRVGLTVALLTSVSGWAGEPGV